MLIDSPRLKRGDREAWEDRKRYDEVISHSPRIPVITERAREDIRIFAEQGPCSANMRWFLLIWQPLVAWYFLYVGFG